MTQTQHQGEKGQRRNRRVALVCSGVVVGMVGMAYAAVPLYDLFCRVTGYGGTTQVTETLADEVLDQTITIEFDSSIARGLPWDFQPLQRSQTLKIGEMGLALYKATNTSDRTSRWHSNLQRDAPKGRRVFCENRLFLFYGTRIEAR